MAVPTSYLTSIKNLNAVLAAIQKAGVPAKFTYEFLKQLGFPSSNDRPLIPVFKALRFLDSTGTPQDRYRRFRDSAQSGVVMAEGLRDAYADVFAVNQQPQALPKDELKGVFARLSGKSDVVAEKMALTFKSLAAHADFTAAPGEEPSKEEVAEEPEVKTASDRTTGKQLPLQLHHDIHVHLPVSTEVDVYDAIFRALRQNFAE